MAFKQFDIEFTKEGTVHDQAQMEQALQGTEGLTDLVVISHGWNNDMAEAKALYDRLCANLEAVLGLDIVDGTKGRKFGVLRVFWPSKRFADEDLIPGGGAASATKPNNEALLRLLEELKCEPRLLGGTETSPTRVACVEAAKKLVPRLEADPAARREFVLQLRSLLDPSAAHPDDGSEEFFTRDPEDLFNGLQTPVNAPAGPSGGGATAVGGRGGATGLGDLVSGVLAAARRIANFTTYYEMKARAGTVGSTGLAPLLRALRDRRPSLKLHLVGHSFGGRLVTAAANALPADTRAVTVSLLQAAYSHNGLGKRYDSEHDGAFRAMVEQRRASGPIIITHTKNDRAVGIAYPLASRLSHQQASALGDQNDPYGGMGRNGAQHTPEARALPMVKPGQAYSFEPGKIYNLLADDFIKDHGDVTGAEVAYAILNAVAAV